MLPIINLARRIRHSPALRRAEGLWSLVRPIWNFAVDPLQRGVPVIWAGHIVRVPPQLISTGEDWENYETPSFTRIAKWLKTHPDGLFLDICCSLGAFTTFVLQVSDSSQVIAFDSDTTSLRAMDSTVPRAAQNRLQRVWGLLGAEHKSGDDLPQALSTTLKNLPSISPCAAIPTSCYVCFVGEDSDLQPWHSLDGLLQTSTSRIVR